MKNIILTLTLSIIAYLALYRLSLPPKTAAALIGVTILISIVGSALFRREEKIPVSKKDLETLIRLNEESNEIAKRISLSRSNSKKLRAENERIAEQVKAIEQKYK